MEPGETIADALVREVEEETGLLTKPLKLLYLAEQPANEPPLIHITFLLRRVAGQLRNPPTALDQNPIHEVRMVPVEELRDHGFSERFADLVREGFPDSGSYVGAKTAIGLSDQKASAAT